MKWRSSALVAILFFVLVLSRGPGQSIGPSFTETISELEAQGASVYLVVPATRCQGPSDADDVTAFLLLAAEEDLPTGTVNYKVNQSRIPRNLDANETLSAIDAAFDRWEFPGGHTFDNSGDTTATFGDDDQNVVSFVRFAGPKILLPLAFAVLDPGDENDGEFDIVLLANWNWSTNPNFTGNPDTVDGGCGGRPGKVDVQTVVTHEAGHAVRLGHPSNDRQTMAPSIARRELFKRTLADGDKCGMEERYSSVETTVACPAD